MCFCSNISGDSDLIGVEDNPQFAYEDPAKNAKPRRNTVFEKNKNTVNISDYLTIFYVIIFTLKWVCFLCIIAIINDLHISLLLQWCIKNSDSPVIFSQVCSSITITSLGVYFIFGGCCSEGVLEERKEWTWGPCCGIQRMANQLSCWPHKVVVKATHSHVNLRQSEANINLVGCQSYPITQVSWRIFHWNTSRMGTAFPPDICAKKNSNPFEDRLLLHRVKCIFFQIFWGTRQKMAAKPISGAYYSIKI